MPRMNDMKPHPSLDPDTTLALRLFLAQVSARYAVSGAYLFGSRARGDFRAGSDADVALLLCGPQGSFLDTELDLADIAYDVLLETGIRIQPLPVWEAEWAHPETYSDPKLLGSISREGIRL
jgi:predicted nucleotidyltransferase